MRAINLQRAVRIVLLAGVGVLSAGQASASGFALAEQNSSGLGNAYAGAAAVAEDASTIFSIQLVYPGSVVHHLWSICRE